MIRAAFVLSVITFLAAPTHAGQVGQTLPPQPKIPAKPLADPNKPPDLIDPTRDPSLELSNETEEDRNNLKPLGGDAAIVQVEDYAGPSILSRNFLLTRPSIVKNEKFSAYAGVDAYYDSGLLGSSVQNGQNRNFSTAAWDVNWGISGRRYRRKDIIDLNYSGQFYDYAADTRYNGQDHSFSLGYTREISSHFSVGVRESAGVYANAYSILNSTALPDASLTTASLVVPTDSLGDRTYYSTLQGSLVWQNTARLSFSFNGEDFLVHRNSLQLADSNGTRTSLDVAYRLTRRQTIGAYYSHSAYTFGRQFGSVNADGLGGTYTILLSRNMDLVARAGVSRYEIQTLAIVTPNPLVQAVLGISSGVEKQYTVGYAPDITLTLDRRLKKSSMGATFTKSISPGNGLILTSSHESESLFYNLPEFRRYATQFSAGRDKLSAYGNTPGQYSSYFARFSFSRPVMRNVSSVFGFDFRRYSADLKSFQQSEIRVSVGLRYGPGDRAARFW